MLPMHNGVTLQGSLDKVWEVKTKLNNSLTSSSRTINNDIHVSMDITDYVKLNGCCNAAIEMDEKLMVILPLESESFKVCDNRIHAILYIKNKIKAKINSAYGNTLFS